MEKIEILAIGAHPDDVELGVGGIMATAARSGHKVGIVDLTRGEMASKGTVEQRDQEALEAAKILNATWRKNLNIPDRAISSTRENINKLVEIIRLTKPKLILAPYWEDRHPDHVKASQLVQEAYFDTGLKKVCPELPSYRPPVIAYYGLNKGVNPTLVVDVSVFYKFKLKAINAHCSQFNRNLINSSEGIVGLIKNRDQYYGNIIGTEFGEGLLLNAPLSVKDISLLWRGKE